MHAEVVVLVRDDVVLSRELPLVHGLPLDVGPQHLPKPPHLVLHLLRRALGRDDLGIPLAQPRPRHGELELDRLELDQELILRRAHLGLHLRRLAHELGLLLDQRAVEPEEPTQQRGRVAPELAHEQLELVRKHAGLVLQLEEAGLVPFELGLEALEVRVAVAARVRAARHRPNPAAHELHVVRVLLVGHPGSTAAAQRRRRGCPHRPQPRRPRFHRPSSRQQRLLALLNRKVCQKSPLANTPPPGAGQTNHHTPNYSRLLVR
mmetsp:Transcript_17938/g.47052  ORF Transcript_17938/g.47052 Transcript_17938/m.47052 type:complete len:263 (-) Transcript_17938:43-831(-)